VSATVTRAAIALGSNMSDRFELLRSARDAIAQIRGVQIVATSQMEETEALGPRQPVFLNQMVLIETTRSLPALLAELQQVEQVHGRQRRVPKGPRTLDLDIVWAGGLTITSTELLIPHPGLHDRVFWQRELAEVLGVDAAADAIGSAHVHAGMDTATHDSDAVVRRWSGAWDAID
jgi:2-amino-4-hydroxy-6-hydroxymethyldihydropteridine diphosphokinase